MIRVHNIMKDGTERESLKGFVLTPENCPQIYDYFRWLNDKIQREETEKKKGE